MSEENKPCSVPSNGEPTATRSTVPIWIVVLTLLLLFLGFVYFDHHSGWFNSQVYAPYATAEQLEDYQPKSGAAAALAHGKIVFETYCGLCHGTDGAGKPGVAPPLAGSEWVNTKGDARLAHIPLMGLNGTISVEGKDWSLAMAPMGAGLSDEDLAGVLTYIRSSWGNKGGEVSADDVKAVRSAIGGHPQPTSGPDLMKMPE